MDNKEPQVKYEGVLPLNNVDINCYVLEDGTRLLSGREMQRALAMVDDIDNKQTAGTRLSRYLNQKSLKPFIYKGKEPGHFEPIVCYKGDTKINGYEATVLIDICDAFLQARKDIKTLSSRQAIIADQCEILLRSFAKIGLIALIDEATGYQYDREQKELQTILKALVSDEILEYQKQFQLSFYKEIFRLWGIPFTPKNIQRKPQFVGHLTNKYVYSNLPKGTFVLEKLKSNTPKTKSGNFRYRLHQSLTEDKGREALKKVLYSIEALASVSKNKREFDRLVQQKYGQQEIPFEDLEQIEESESKKQVKQLNIEDLPIFDQKLNQALNFNPNKDNKKKNKEDSSEQE